MVARELNARAVEMKLVTLRKARKRRAGSKIMIPIPEQNRTSVEMVNIFKQAEVLEEESEDVDDCDCD